MRMILLLTIGLFGSTYGISFGFISCTTLSNQYAESGDEFTLTYFDGNKQFHCVIQAENNEGGTTYKCSDKPKGNDVTAIKCGIAIEPGKYGLQISNPYNQYEQEDDICVDAIIVNGNEYNVNGEWVGDGSGAAFQNYRFFATAPPDELGDLGDLTSVKVAGIPACFTGAKYL